MSRPPHISGVATTLVGTNYPSSIDIVKRGEAVASSGDIGVQRWGDYSAVAFLGETVWFAVPFAQAVTDQQLTNYGSFIFPRWL